MMTHARERIAIDRRTQARPRQGRSAAFYRPPIDRATANLAPPLAGGMGI